MIQIPEDIFEYSIRGDFSPYLERERERKPGFLAETNKRARLVRIAGHYYGIIQ